MLNMNFIVVVVVGTLVPLKTSNVDEFHAHNKSHNKQKAKK